jgi:hypothetical protein
MRRNAEVYYTEVYGPGHFLVNSASPGLIIDNEVFEAARAQAEASARNIDDSCSFAKLRTRSFGDSSRRAGTSASGKAPASDTGLQGLQRTSGVIPRLSVLFRRNVRAIPHSVSGVFNAGFRRQPVLPVLRRGDSVDIADADIGFA